LTRLGRPENIDSTIDKTKNQGLTQKLNQNKDLNQNKIKTKKNTKTIKFSYENISNTKKNKEHEE